jgi:hypothetical protein
VPGGGGRKRNETDDGVRCRGPAPPHDVTKNSGTRNDEEVGEDIRMGRCQIWMVEEAAEGGLDVVTVLEDWF